MANDSAQPISSSFTIVNTTLLFVDLSALFLRVDFVCTNFVYVTVILASAKIDAVHLCPIVGAFFSTMQTDWLVLFSATNILHRGRMKKLRPNSDIEILRAFAIIMVLIQHYPSLYFWSDHSFFTKVNTYLSFWSGVDLFLCISGFVVSCSLIPLIDKCKDNRLSSSSAIKSFFIKRAFRLFPTSFLWISIILLMTLIYNVSGAFGNLNWNLYQSASVLTYNYNYLSAYMTEHGLPTTLGPFWS